VKHLKGQRASAWSKSAPREDDLSGMSMKVFHTTHCDQVELAKMPSVYLTSLQATDASRNARSRFGLYATRERLRSTCTDCCRHAIYPARPFTAFPNKHNLHLLAPSSAHQTLPCPSTPKDPSATPPTSPKQHSICLSYRFSESRSRTTPRHSTRRTSSKSPLSA
jgi:hypothetical protein